MKLKHKLSVFNVFIKLILLIILWLVFPYVVKALIYNHTDVSLLAKKEKFKSNLKSIAIEKFLSANDSTKRLISFHKLNDEYLQLKISPDQKKVKNNVFLNDTKKVLDQIHQYRILRHEFSYNNVNYQLEIGSTIKSINDLIFLVHQIIIYAFIFITLIIFIVDLLYVSYLLKPFYKILETKIKRIDSSEKFNYVPIASKTDEFQELDSALNQMMNRINELFTNEKQFIANVSHELLTPISILKNRFENLIHIQNLDNDAVDKISDSLLTLDMMKKIINNLLLISRIDDKQYKTDENINLEEIIIELVVQLEDRIHEKSINCTVNLKHNYLLLGNKTLIQILINNLLTNAIKYSYQNGSITIDDESTNHHYFLNITDTGFGMNELQISQIFNRFSRLCFDNEGQGLGLTIAKSIATLHQIEIKVISNVSKGTTFTLIFHR